MIEFLTGSSRRVRAYGYEHVYVSGALDQWQYYPHLASITHQILIQNVIDRIYLAYFARYPFEGVMADFESMV